LQPRVDTPAGIPAPYELDHRIGRIALKKRALQALARTD